MEVPVLKEFTSLLTQRLYQKTRVEAKKLINRLPESLDLNPLRADKEIQAKVAEYNAILKFYMSKLTRVEKAQELKESCKSYEKMNRLIDITGFDTSNLKQNTLQTVTNFIAIIHLKLRLIELQKTLKIPILLNKPKTIKRQKKAIKEYNEICSQIVVLKNASGLIDDKSEQNLIEFATKIQSLMDALCNLKATATKHQEPAESNDPDFEDIDFADLDFSKVAETEAASNASLILSSGIFGGKNKSDVNGIDEEAKVADRYDFY
jgi:hypothetical protein